MLLDLQALLHLAWRQAALPGDAPPGEGLPWDTLVPLLVAPRPLTTRQIVDRLLRSLSGSGARQQGATERLLRRARQLTRATGAEPSLTAALPLLAALEPPPTAEPLPAHPNPLPVEYFDQMLMDDGEGWRDCFSASCGMLARYWGKISDQNKYNHMRQQYGDSTDSNAQLKTLQSLGLKASFHTDGKAENLKAEIDAGRPVAVGWLHHGPVSAPSGGGHWTVVIGYDDSGFLMNDPYGSCDLANGGHPGGGNPNDQLGKRDHYSYKNWLPRWQPAGTPGWYLTCSA